MAVPTSLYQIWNTPLAAFGPITIAEGKDEDKRNPDNRKRIEIVRQWHSRSDLYKFPYDEDQWLSENADWSPLLYIHTNRPINLPLLAATYAIGTYYDNHPGEPNQLVNAWNMRHANEDTVRGAEAKLPSYYREFARQHSIFMFYHTYLPTVHDAIGDAVIPHFQNIEVELPAINDTYGDNIPDGYPYQDHILIPTLYTLSDQLDDAFSIEDAQIKIQQQASKYKRSDPVKDEERDLKAVLLYDADITTLSEHTEWYFGAFDPVALLNAYLTVDVSQTSKTVRRFYYYSLVAMADLLPTETGMHIKTREAMHAAGVEPIYVSGLEQTPFLKELGLETHGGLYSILQGYGKVTRQDAIDRILAA